MWIYILHINAYFVSHQNEHLKCKQIYVISCQVRILSDFLYELLIYLVAFLMFNIKLLQDSHNTSEIKPANQVSHESQCEQPNNVTETPAPDSGSVSVSNNDNRKVSRQDIELVRQLFILHACSCCLWYFNNKFQDSVLYIDYDHYLL